MNHVHSVAKLEAFFKEVAKLTLNHNEEKDMGAYVTAADLGKALEKVDPEWFMEYPKKDS